MAIDPNILLANQSQVPLMNPLDMMAKAMTLKQLSNQGQEQDRELADKQSMRDAYKAALKTSPDGSVAIDQPTYMSTLAQKNPMLAVQEGQRLKAQSLQAQEQNLTLLKQQSEAKKQLIAGVNDEPSYNNFYQTANKLNLPGADKLSPVFPGMDMVNQIKQSVLSHDEQLADQKFQFDQQNKGDNRDEKSREFDLRQQGVDVQRQANQLKAQDQKNLQVDKLTKDMKKDLDADAGRAGNFGQISAKVQAADRLKTLIAAYKNGDDLKKSDMEELSLGLANMLSGQGGAARSQVEALVPHTYFGDTQSGISKLLNQPRGAGQGAFVDQMAHTIDRERDTANNQLNQIRANRLPAHGLLQRLSPDAYNGVLNGYQFDPNKVGSDGIYKAPSATDHASGAAAELERRAKQ